MYLLPQRQNPPEPSATLLHHIKLPRTVFVLAQQTPLMVSKTFRFYGCTVVFYAVFYKADCLQTDMIAGPRATARRELRQVRKEATAAAPAVCRG